MNLVISILLMMQPMPLLKNAHHVPKVASTNGIIIRMNYPTVLTFRYDSNLIPQNYNWEIEATTNFVNWFHYSYPSNSLAPLQTTNRLMFFRAKGTPK